MEKEKSKMRVGKKRTLVNTSVLIFIGVGVLLFLVIGYYLFKYFNIFDLYNSSKCGNY